jgi:hypothetical protein
MVISPSARTVLADLSRPQVYYRDWTVGRLLADMSSASRFDHAQIVQIIFLFERVDSDVLVAFSLLYGSFEVSWDSGCIEAEVRMLFAIFSCLRCV